jgi:hypothetical protein
MKRPTRWTEDLIVQAFQEFHRIHGCQPSVRDVRGEDLLPSHDTVIRHFESWDNACVAAGFEGYPPGWAETKDEETAVLMQRIEAGETLTQVGRELGVSGQALGRRIARYRRRHGLPPLGLSPGRRSKLLT